MCTAMEPTIKERGRTNICSEQIKCCPQVGASFKQTLHEIEQQKQTIVATESIGGNAYIPYQGQTSSS